LDEIARLENCESQEKNENQYAIDQQHEHLFIRHQCWAGAKSAIGGIDSLATGLEADIAKQQTMGLRANRGG
jgi:hypothetical protein